MIDRVESERRIEKEKNPGQTVTYISFLLKNDEKQQTDVTKTNLNTYKTYYYMNSKCSTINCRDWSRPETGK